MAALTAARNTPRLGGDTDPYDATVKAATTVYAGSLVALDATGLLVPGAAATTLRAMGRCRKTATAAEVVAVDSGVFLWDNSASTDLIAQADVGNNCYIVDDHTVAKTDGTGSRSVAGKIVGVTSSGVWVATKFAN